MSRDSGFAKFLKLASQIPNAVQGLPSILENMKNVNSADKGESFLAARPLCNPAPYKYIIREGTIGQFNSYQANTSGKLKLSPDYDIPATKDGTVLKIGDNIVGHGKIVDIKLALGSIAFIVFEGDTTHYNPYFLIKEENPKPESNSAPHIEWKEDNGVEYYLENGKRIFKSGAVRSDNAGKPRFDLISPLAMEWLAELLGREAADKGASNYLKGLPEKVCIESLLRHVNSYQLGDEEDAVNILFNAMALCHTIKLNRD